MPVTKFTEDECKTNSYLGEGTHEVKVVDVANSNSKQGNPMFEVLVADNLGRTRKEYFSASEKSKWKLAGFAKACGFTDDDLKKGIDIPLCFRDKLLKCVVTTKGKRVVEGKTFDNHVAAFFVTDNGKAPVFDEDDIPF